MDNLILFWKKQSFNKPPFIAGSDKDLLNNRNQISITTNYSQFLKSKIIWNTHNNFIELGLIPKPYIGNLSSAKIFVLQLNPGLSFGDYFAELEFRNFQNILIENLQQKINKNVYPFIFLNPTYSWHPGFEYWHRKFQPVIEEIVRIKKWSYLETLKFLSQKVACLELLPYHSRKAPPITIQKKILSLEKMRQFAIQKAEDSKILLIVVRGVKQWGLKESHNVIIYPAKEARGASLKKVVKKICEKLGI